MPTHLRLPRCRRARSTRAPCGGTATRRGASARRRSYGAARGDDGDGGVGASRFSISSPKRELLHQRWRRARPQHALEPSAVFAAGRQGRTVASALLRPEFQSQRALDGHRQSPYVRELRFEGTESFGDTPETSCGGAARPPRRLSDERCAPPAPPRRCAPTSVDVRRQSRSRTNIGGARGWCGRPSSSAAGRRVAPAAPPAVRRPELPSVAASCSYLARPVPAGGC